MDVGEFVFAGVMADMSEECPFDHEDGPYDRKNDFKNNSAKLRSELKKAEGADAGEPMTFAYGYLGDLRKGNLKFNAHHLLPADDAVNNAKDLLQWLKKTGNVRGDVGYGVNHARNGVFLPSNDGWDSDKLGKWSAIGRRPRGFATQYAYAFWAMRLTGCQFHDSHRPYSAWVRSKLDDIRMKSLNLKDSCPKCDETNNKRKFKPPYQLRQVLDSFASRLRGILTGSPRRWQAPLTTSFMSELYSIGHTPETVARLGLG